MKTILITGARGLCGLAIREEYIKQSSSNFREYSMIFADRSMGDLKNNNIVVELFAKYKPNIVVHTAARVGGIGANLSSPAELFYDNMMMNMNIVKNCVDFKVEKLLAFSSVCVFPDSLELLSEDKMHDGPVYFANAAYGYAKRMIDVHIEAVNKQYGIHNYCSLIPGNIFGKNDLFELKDSHVVPALIHKLFLAKVNNSKFYVWGDGSSLREFIYVNDLAKVILSLIRQEDPIPKRLIVSGKEEFSIRDIVDALVHIADFNNEVVYQTNKPNGQYRVPSDKTNFDFTFPNFEYTDIYDALKETWDWFCANYKDVRK